MFVRTLKFPFGRNVDFGISLSKAKRSSDVFLPAKSHCTKSFDRPGNGPEFRISHYEKIGIYNDE
jgi:hypothetical protein